jgi:hypothetical protein
MLILEIELVLEGVRDEHESLLDGRRRVMPCLKPARAAMVGPLCIS